MAYHFTAHDGTLMPIDRTPVPAGITPLALDGSRGMLYAGVRDQPAALSFAIDRHTGRLSQRARAELADPPMYLGVDAAGRFLLSASYAGATFAIHPLANGQIGAAIERRPTPPRAHAIHTDPSNRFLFVTALGGDAILQYLFDASTGRTTPNPVPAVSTPAGSGPRHLVFHPRGDVLYVNGELDGSMTSFALDSDTGRLQPIVQTSMLPDPSPTQAWAADLAIDPSGAFLYASERRTSTLAAFDLRGDPGALRRIGIVATESQPRALAIDPSGAYVFAAGELSSQVTVYAIDAATGDLTPRGRVSTAEKPVWIAATTLPPPG